MTTQPILAKVIAENAKRYPSGLNKDETFEFFCADNILANYDLTDAEILSGIVDGKGDGGIDAVYLFAGRRLVGSDFNFKNVSEPVEIELIVIQSKNVDKFSEIPLDKLSTGLAMLLAEKPNKSQIAKTFSADVIKRFDLFKKSQERLAAKFPEVYVKVYYACRGSKISESIEAKAGSLEGWLAEQYDDALVEVMGVGELYKLAKKQKDLTLELEVVGTPLFNEGGTVVLSTLKTYAAFISDGKSNLINRMFDANVRDYQGSVEVNKEIAATLAEKGTPDFWWMNNGITIVADKARWVSPKMVIKNPLVVNGLQTSFEIHANRKKLLKDTRNVLVKVIEETDQKRRDRIIRATNRQTSIKHSSFRASEEIHALIQDHLETIGLFYDRRNNSQKRLGRPADKIVTIDRLAQAVMAVHLKAPQTARARPTTAIKNDADYNRIFPAPPNTHPLGLYDVCAQLLIATELHFRGLKGHVDQVKLNNLRFHVLMVLSWALNADQNLPVVRIAQLKASKVTPTMMGKVASWVFKEFELAGDEDRVAKDKAFTERLQKNWTVAKTS